jgi:hypothetical protein
VLDQGYGIQPSPQIVLMRHLLFKVDKPDLVLSQLFCQKLEVGTGKLNYRITVYYYLTY